MMALGGDAKGGLPAVVAESGHRDFRPGGGRFMAVQQQGGEDFVPVGEDIGAHFHFLADHAFDRETPAVHLRPHPGNHHAARSPA